jgi:carbon monoxide dehydrogenase subunit G
MAVAPGRDRIEVIMPTVSTSIYFDAPQDRVWEVVTDLANAADRISAIMRLELLTDGPVGMGTRFRETRVMFRKEASEEMEITEWDPPHRYVTEAESHGARYRTTISCTPDGDRTRVEMTMEATPLSFFAKLMGVALGWMMKGVCRRAFETDLEDLRSVIEGSATPQPA